jgi:HK97 family phage portal protein
MLNWLSNARKNTAAFFNNDLTVSLTDNKGWPKYFGSLSSAGVVVDANSSQQLSAYYACLRNISEDLAKLPKAVFTPAAEGGREKANAQVTKVINEQPNPHMTAFNFWQFMFFNAPGWGDSIAEIQKNRRGDIIAMHPIHPSRVIKAKWDNGLVWVVRGDDNSDTVILKDSEVYHLTNTTSNGLTGIPLPTIGQESLGAALATQDFTAKFFNNGALLTGVLEHPNQLSTEAADRLRANWQTMYGGSSNAGKTAILEEGMKFHTMTMPLKDAELLEQKKFQIEEIARWFRMPPHKIAHMENATFTNIESQAREYVDDTLMSWAIRAEQEIKRKLLPGSKQFAKFNFNSLLRGDSAARKEYYTSMFNIGVFNVNEIRELEDMNPIENGKKHYVQGNLMLLGDVGMSSQQEETTPEEPEEAEPVIIDDEEIDMSMFVLNLKPIVNDYFRDLVNREVKTFTNTYKRFVSGKIDEAGFIEYVDNFYSDYRAKANEKLIIYSNAVKQMSGQDFSYKSMLVSVSDTSAQLLKNTVTDEMAFSGLLEDWSITKADALTDQFFGIATAEPEFKEVAKVGDFGEFDGKLYKLNDKLDWEPVDVSDNG